MAVKKKKYQTGSTVTAGAAPTLEQRHDPILGTTEKQAGIDPTQTTTSLPSGTEMTHSPQTIQTEELMTTTGKALGTAPTATTGQTTAPTQVSVPTAPSPGTYAATTYNETLASNIPTIIYWNPEHWGLSAESDLFFEELK